MDQQLLQGVQGADGHVAGNPCHCQPARPVIAAQHERSTHHRCEPNKDDPGHVKLKRMRGPEVLHVESKPEDTRCDKHATDDSHREWTLFHRYGARSFRQEIQLNITGLPIYNTFTIGKSLSPAHFSHSSALRVRKIRSSSARASFWPKDEMRSSSFVRRLMNNYYKFESIETVD